MRWPWRRIAGLGLEDGEFALRLIGRKTLSVPGGERRGEMRRTNKKKNTTHYVLNTTPEIQTLLDELEACCYSSAIITLIGGNEQSYVIDLKKTSQGYAYGYHPAHKALFVSKLVQNGDGALVLRSFLEEERDPET